VNALASITAVSGRLPRLSLASSFSSSLSGCELTSYSRSNEWGYILRWTQRKMQMRDAGQWYFDAAAGREEILARRIGDNELAIMDVEVHQ
jgi:hypothetical protein